MLKVDTKTANLATLQIFDVKERNECRIPNPPHKTNKVYLKEKLNIGFLQYTWIEEKMPN